MTPARNPRSVVIHGHFYQPPREDAWLDAVRAQPSAAPDHDWNARVTRECYDPVTRARVVRDGHDGFMNTLEFLSFNFGPTLLRWLERKEPTVYARILDADRASLERLGHGNAIAQSYHHSILPLASKRDKRTEVRWGVADFVRRFGRAPEGIWVPETAVDVETLDVLGDEGLSFVVLAPHQVEPRPLGGAPGWYRTAGGARIALVPYDGALSHEVAFGQATRDGAAWAERLATIGTESARPPETGAERQEEGRRLVAIATDGETYGHHKKFAEMGLAAALHHLLARDDVIVENFASFLGRNPPTTQVDIVAPSSRWSCGHGVDRWKADCGCRLDAGSDTRQAWRAPLRDGLERLADALHELYEVQTGRWLTDPWEARDAYGALVHLRDREEVWDGLSAHLSDSARDCSPEQRARILELLEMERNALRMFTSCAWFFDDITRVEPRQVLEYAERAIELSGEGDRVRPMLLDALRQAESNDERWANAAEFYEDRVLGSRPLRAEQGTPTGGV